MGNFQGGATAAKFQTTRFFEERPLRAPDYHIDNEALLKLSQCLADSPATVLTEMCNRVLELCNCESAGVSLLQQDENGGEVFFWAALVGAWAPYLGGKMPRHASPCGLVIDGQATMIFQDAAKDFPATAQANPLIAEILLVPFYVGEKPVGTVWGITHHSGHRFDREDERRLKSLAGFASPAYQFGKAQVAMESAIVARDAADAAATAVEAKWEQLFQDLYEGFILGELVRDGDGRATDWRYLQINKAWTRMLGFPAEKVVGRTVREVFPEIEEEWIADFARAVDTGEPVRFTRQVGGVDRWYDGVGQSAGGDQFTVLFIDVTERVLAAQRQSIINYEIVHRQKNTLMLVQAIASQTLKSTVEPEALESFGLRLQALGKAQGILFGRGLRKAPLEEVIRQSLDNASAASRFRAEGPHILLSAEAALTLSLIIHELVTNAFKYGALSTSGSVAISWNCDGEGDEAQLVLKWIETGGPPASPPSRKGFGSKLLSIGLGGMGPGELRYDPEGFSATFRGLLKKLERD